MKRERKFSLFLLYLLLSCVIASGCFHGHLPFFPKVLSFFPSSIFDAIILRFCQFCRNYKCDVILLVDIVIFFRMKFRNDVFRLLVLVSKFIKISNDSSCPPDRRCPI